MDYIDSRFFNPFIGKNYEKGILGKKVLVIGEEFYCEENCKFRYLCANPNIRNSRPFDTTCEYYKKMKAADFGEIGIRLYKDPKSKVKLSDAPWLRLYEHCFDAPAYKNFSDFFAEYLHDNSIIKNPLIFWDMVAFSNYVQFMVPKSREDKKDICIDEVSWNNAFIDTIDQISPSPDLIIIWGINFKQYIQKLCCDVNEVEESKHWFYHININDEQEHKHSGEIYPVINCYHPCDRGNYFSKHREEFKYWLDKILC